MQSLILITIVNILVITLVVLLHHEALILLSQLMGKRQEKARQRVLIGVFGTLVAHSIEVWIFGIAYYLLQNVESLGEITGNFNGSFLDCLYLSFTCFTTLGFGDVVAIGNIRFLTVLESLTGLVLITWTASFLYLQMQRFWHSEEGGAKDQF
jgi:hypothetical protein